MSPSITDEFSATGGNQLSTRGGGGVPRRVSLTLGYRLRLQRSHFLVSSVNSPCNASLGRNGCSRSDLKFYPVITLILAHWGLFDLHLYCVISRARLFKGFRVALPFKLMV